MIYVRLSALLFLLALLAMVLHFTGTLPGDPWTTYIGSPLIVLCAVLVMLVQRRCQNHPMQGLVEDQKRDGRI